jgi:hypothetical protein
VNLKRQRGKTKRRRGAHGWTPDDDAVATTYDEHADDDDATTVELAR